jgi:hypothetical protein
MQNEDTTPINDKRQSHGCWKIFNIDNSIKAIAFFINGRVYGYYCTKFQNIANVKIYYAR